MVRYKMVGRDTNSLPTQQRVWIVNDNPDYSGEQYTGLKSGSSPFVDVVGYQIPDGYTMDFNLPLPLNWSPVPLTLPAAISNSQLAIIDGYAYLFGGESSNKIYRADINNPAHWFDTGSTLPTVLSSSQLAIIDGYIYLFGGKNTQSVDTIFRAPINNPLSWSNTGAFLPEEISNSSLAFASGYVYLFGGQGINGVKDNIWRAPITNPLLWTDTGSVIPKPLYGSQIAIMSGKIILLGGFLQNNQPTNEIYSCQFYDPLTWSLLGNLPKPVGFGQFITVGPYGYLYGEAAINNGIPSKTRIFRCSMDTPDIWIDTGITLPSHIAQSQFAIIYDRIFSFGGNGMSVILASKQLLKYQPNDSIAFAYATNTRVAFEGAITLFARNEVIGFPYWKTSY